MGLPVILPASVSLAVNQTGTFDSRALSHPYRKPMLVTDIQFQLRIAGITSGELGGLIWIDAQMGQHRLTIAPVPIWVLGPLISFGDFTRVGNSNVVDNGKRYLFSFYNWRLPRPMYVPPDGSVTMTAFRSPLIDGDASSPAGAVQVYAAIVGKTLDAPMSTSDVPYATAFVAANADIQSGESALKNELASPIRLTWIGARVGVSGTTDNLSANTPTVSARNMQMRHGRDFIVRDRTPWIEVFSQQRCGISTDAILNPGDRYQVSLFNTVAASYRPMVSIVGWRPERI